MRVWRELALQQQKNQHTPHTHTHNSGILGIWEIKCTKYLFCTERGHYSFLYIFNYFQISYCTYCTCIYLYSDFSSLFCLSIGLRGRIWWIVCLSARKWCTASLRRCSILADRLVTGLVPIWIIWFIVWRRWFTAIFARLAIDSVLIWIILFLIISVSFPTNTNFPTNFPTNTNSKNNHSNQA